MSTFLHFCKSIIPNGTFHVPKTHRIWTWGGAPTKLKSESFSEVSAFYVMRSSDSRARSRSEAGRGGGCSFGFVIFPTLGNFNTK